MVVGSLPRLQRVVSAAWRARAVVVSSLAVGLGRLRGAVVGSCPWRSAGRCRRRVVADARPSLIERSVGVAGVAVACLRRVVAARCSCRCRVEARCHGCVPGRSHRAFVGRCLCWPVSTSVCRLTPLLRGCFVGGSVGCSAGVLVGGWRFAAVAARRFRLGRSASLWFRRWPPVVDGSVVPVLVLLSGGPPVGAGAGSLPTRGPR